MQPEPPDSAYRPRVDDHLVEPMFAGLGVGEEDVEGSEGEPTPGAGDRSGPSPERRRPDGLWARLRAWMGARGGR